jgi:putative transposase
MIETTVESSPVDEREVDSQPQAPSDLVECTASDEQLIAMLVDRARREGLQLTGEGGLLQHLTRRVLTDGGRVDLQQFPTALSESRSAGGRRR